MKMIQCRECGATIPADSLACPNCGVLVESFPINAEKGYYGKLFDEFDTAGGKFKLTWNWRPCFFGPFWYIFHKIWIKGVLLLIITIVFPTAIPFLSIYEGVAGNYDLYLVKRKGNQLW